MFAELPEITRLGNWLIFFIDFEAIIGILLFAGSALQDQVNFRNFKTCDGDVQIAVECH